MLSFLRWEHSRCVQEEWKRHTSLEEVKLYHQSRSHWLHNPHNLIFVSDRKMRQGCQQLIIFKNQVHFRTTKRWHTHILGMMWQLATSQQAHQLAQNHKRKQCFNCHKLASNGRDGVGICILKCVYSLQTLLPTPLFAFVLSGHSWSKVQFPSSQ